MTEMGDHLKISLYNHTVKLSYRALEIIQSNPLTSQKGSDFSQSFTYV